MSSKTGEKISQADMLQRMSPPPFDQRNVVPKEAKIVKSPADRWWRSDSPLRGQEKDFSVDTAKAPSPNTQGVFGWGKRGKFESQYQTGSGTAHHFKVDGESLPPTISGYSGFIPGKYAGNVVGGTFNQSNYDAENHLRRTVQAMKYSN